MLLFPLKKQAMPGEKVIHTITFKDKLQTVELMILINTPSTPIMDTMLLPPMLPIWKPQELPLLTNKKLVMYGEKVTHGITMLLLNKILQIVEMTQPTDIPSKPIMDITLF